MIEKIIEKVAGLAIGLLFGFTAFFAIMTLYFGIRAH